MRPMLIRDRYSRLCLLTNKKAETLGEAWLAAQEKEPLADADWYTAYPLSGGAVLVQDGTYEPLRQATPKDILEAVDSRKHGFNPAAESIINLLMEG